MRVRTGYVGPPNTRLTGEKSLLNIRFRCRSEQILAIFLKDIVRTASRGDFCSNCPNITFMVERFFRLSIWSEFSMFEICFKYDNRVIMIFSEIFFRQFNNVIIRYDLKIE